MWLQTMTSLDDERDDSVTASAPLSVMSKAQLTLCHKWIGGHCLFMLIIKAEATGKHQLEVCYDPSVASEGGITGNGDIY